MTTPDALKLAADLRDWSDDADTHNAHHVPASPETLRKCASMLKQQHAALESLRSMHDGEAIEEILRASHELSAALVHPTLVMHKPQSFSSQIMRAAIKEFESLHAENESLKHSILAQSVEQTRLCAEIDSLRAGRAVPDEDAREALEELFNVLSESMRSGGWVPTPLHASSSFAMTQAARALSAAPTPPQASQAVPDVLFDGYAVLQALDVKAKTRTSLENVSDVLDAVVRIMRATPPQAEQSDCTRSHPHEDMGPICELKNQMARLTNENARLKATPADHGGEA